MVIADIMFDEFFSKPIPAQGFEIDPTTFIYPGLIQKATYGNQELHGYEVTIKGEVVVPEFGPVNEIRKG